LSDAPEPRSLEAWAGRDHRAPSRGLPSWSIREPLARWLEAESRSAGGLRILDVGCGVKPYLPFFTSAREYVGADLPGNPYADVVGTAEMLPVDDGAFDLVLCLQVLEHVEEPGAVIRELHRVTRPGGRVLLATHGVQVFHPYPVDHWRWTQTGLERLFERNGSWRSITVTPGAGTCACLGMLLSTYIDLIGQKLHAVWASSLVVRFVNRVSGVLDSRVSSLREPIPGSLFANYHVVAER
jgi:SAM-dependent methyltransferase